MYPNRGLPVFNTRLASTGVTPPPEAAYDIASSSNVPGSHEPEGGRPRAVFATRPPLSTWGFPQHLIATNVR